MTENIPCAVWAFGLTKAEVDRRLEFTRQYVSEHAERTAVIEVLPRMVYN